MFCSLHWPQQNCTRLKFNFRWSSTKLSIRPAPQFIHIHAAVYGVYNSGINLCMFSSSLRSWLLYSLHFVFIETFLTSLTVLGFWLLRSPTRIHLLRQLVCHWLPHVLLQSVPCHQFLLRKIGPKPPHLSHRDSPAAISSWSRRWKKLKYQSGGACLHSKTSSQTEDTSNGLCLSLESGTLRSLFLRCAPRPTLNSWN